MKFRLIKEGNGFSFSTFPIFIFEIRDFHELARFDFEERTTLVRRFENLKLDTNFIRLDLLNNFKYEA